MTTTTKNITSKAADTSKGIAHRRTVRDSLQQSDGQINSVLEQIIYSS
jgi:hypothetical protein